MANSVLRGRRSISRSALRSRRGRRDAGRAEAAGGAFRPRQCGRLAPAYSRYRGNDELCDAHAALDMERRVTQIDENDHDLAPVVGIDGTGAVQYGDAVPRREAGARPDLCL